MKKSLLWMTMVVIVTTVSVTSMGAQAPPKLAGWWEGTLNGNGVQMRLQLHITRSGNSWQGEFTSLDEGGAKFPATSITRHGALVTIAATEIGASFAATLHGDQLNGTWKQSGHSWPLAMRRQAGAVSSAMQRPQRPKPPFPYQSFNVKVTSTGGIQLAGTLTLPDGKGPFPAAILIPGSGPATRNETVFGHNIFWVLADALSRHGLAVLRMDKRGVGHSGGDAYTATLTDYAHDAAADLAFLKTRRDIDAKRIGLIGHSEGGPVASMVAAEHPGIAFVVILAGPALPGTTMLVDQIRALDLAHGISPARVAQAVKVEQVYVDTIASAPSPKAAAAALRHAVAQGKLPREILRAVAAASSGEYYSLLRMNPAPYLRRLRCPVLALSGSKDTQVPAQVNIPALRRALANDPRATVVELPGLNHLFQPAKTGLPNEYASIPITFAPAALQRIERWLAGVVGSQP